LIEIHKLFPDRLPGGRLRCKRLPVFSGRTEVKRARIQSLPTWSTFVSGLLQRSVLSFDRWQMMKEQGRPWRFHRRTFAPNRSGSCGQIHLWCQMLSAV
jgi:hypothetical protein